jgi:hypothetical protein
MPFVFAATMAAIAAAYNSLSLQAEIAYNSP